MPTDFSVNKKIEVKIREKLMSSDEESDPTT